MAFPGHDHILGKVSEKPVMWSPSEGVVARQALGPAYSLVPMCRPLVPLRYDPEIARRALSPSERLFGIRTNSRRNCQSSCASSASLRLARQRPVQRLLAGFRGQRLPSRYGPQPAGIAEPDRSCRRRRAALSAMALACLPEGDGAGEFRDEAVDRDEISRQVVLPEKGTEHMLIGVRTSCRPRISAVT